MVTLNAKKTFLDTGNWENLLVIIMALTSTKDLTIDYRRPLPMMINDVGVGRLGGQIPVNLLEEKFQSQWPRSDDEIRSFIFYGGHQLNVHT